MYNVVKNKEIKKSNQNQTFLFIHLVSSKVGIQKVV